MIWELEATTILNKLARKQAVLVTSAVIYRMEVVLHEKYKFKVTVDVC